VTRFGGEHDELWGLWRVDLEGGDRRYVSFPAHTEAAVSVGTKRVVTETCPRRLPPSCCATVLYGEPWATVATTPWT
jgi:hypothetical protein